MLRILKNGLIKFALAFLPTFVQRQIGVLYGFLKRPIRSYSLYGEDLVLLHLFNEVGIKQGTYVDIGCFHPKWISNTHMLSKNGWSGCAVDVDEQKTRLFKKYRPNCASVTAAVTGGDSGEIVKGYFFDRLYSEWDTLSETEALERKNRWGVDFEPRDINTININDVLNMINDNVIDYINIDIEGIDEEIIHAIDFGKFRIHCIQFENNHFFKGSLAVQKKLLEAGFEHYATTGGTHCYVQRELLRHASC